MTEQTISMSTKELIRLEVIQSLHAKCISQKQVAEQLFISVRQVRRLLLAYRLQGTSVNVEGNCLTIVLTMLNENALLLLFRNNTPILIPHSRLNICPVVMVLLIRLKHYVKRTFILCVDTCLPSLYF